MQVSRGFKWSDIQFESDHVSISFDHTDIGLPAPTSVEEAYRTYTNLAYHAEAMKLIQQVKLGRVAPGELMNKLRPYMSDAVIVQLTGIQTNGL